MAELVNLGAWIEGECEAQELTFRLAEQITGAKIPDNRITGEKYKNNWSTVFTSEGDMWVTYKQEKKASTSGVYKHSDEKNYNVYKVIRPKNLANMVYVEATDSYKIYNPQEGGTTKPTFSGESFVFGQITYTDINNEETTVDAEGILCVFIPNDDATAYTGYIVEQYRETSTKSLEKNDNWDTFKIVGELPAQYSQYFNGSSVTVPLGYSSFDYPVQYKTLTANLIAQYTYTKISYVANETHVSQPCALLRALPSGKDGSTTSSEPMFVLLEQPSGDYNHITMKYGRGCIAVDSTGNSLATYADACDPKTVKFGSTPTVINQTKAHEIYLDWNTSTKPAYVPYSVTWGLDYDGETELVSPLSRFYHGRHSTVSWIKNKKRRPDYLVNYSMSVTNDRVLIVIEGDPSPGINDYYRSFAYIGKIVPFNENDHSGNFGITCGMGDLKVEMTDYVLSDISEKNNIEYSKWGEYTSNGMYSFSMFDTRSKVKYQAYYPAFLTQLPNYSDVGTIPEHLSKLILDEDGFQPSIWTDRYHASPVYLVHQAEGYRGYMDGVVAIHDHNLINLDELLVDTEIPKDESDPSQGNYIEVYKFFSLKSPVNMFKYSPAPDAITIAIIKDIE